MVRNQYNALHQTLAYCDSSCNKKSFARRVWRRISYWLFTIQSQSRVQEIITLLYDGMVHSQCDIPRQTLTADDSPLNEESLAERVWRGMSYWLHAIQLREGIIARCSQINGELSLLFFSLLFSLLLANFLASLENNFFKYRSTMCEYLPSRQVFMCGGPYLMRDTWAKKYFVYRMLCATHFSVTHSTNM